MALKLSYFIDSDSRSVEAGSVVNTMEVSVSSSIININKAPISKPHIGRNISMYPKSNVNFNCKEKRNCWIGIHTSETRRVSAVSDISGAADPQPVILTWQIVVGAIAGVTPFVVAGIEFSKRIIAQRRCEVCRGSGLVLKKDYYMRCPECGGFLPWQSWKRFFSG